MNRLLVLPIVVTAIACSSTSSAPVSGGPDTGDAIGDTDAGSDVVIEGDAGDVGDDSSAPDVAADAPITPAGCSTKVSGTAPFASILSGSAASEAGAIDGSVSVYFPHGRVAGKEVVLSMARHAPPGTASIARGVLDSSLSVTGLKTLDSDCGDAVEGTLVGPDDGISATVTRNLSGSGTDAVLTATAHMALCPSGAPGDPYFVLAPVVSVPTAAIVVNGDTPLDPSTFATVTTTPVRPIAVEENGTSLSISGKSAFDPFTETTIDLSGLRDVMGRSLGLSTTKTIALSASVTDPTFTAAPPAGSYLGSVTVTGGVLRASTSYGGEQSILLLGLGSATTKTKLHLHHRFECGAGIGSASASLVSEGGKVVPLTVGCSTSMVDSVVDLPTTGERWALSAVRFTSPSRPCWSPSGTSVTAYELDSFAFE